VERLERHLTALAARSDGEMGRRLALAPREAQFRIDPHDEGFYEQWQRDEVAETVKWPRILLMQDWTQQGYMDEKGRGYDGLAWYRFTMQVPPLEAGETAYLYVPRTSRGTPGVLAERLWIWVNGRLASSPTHDSEH